MATQARIAMIAAAWMFATVYLAAAGADHDALAAEFFSPASFTAGIQEAVVRLPPEGGIAQLPPGRFLLRRSVHLRSNVTLRGSGSATVLRRPSQARSPLARLAEVGNTSVVVADGSVFEVGAQVAEETGESHRNLVTGNHCLGNLKGGVRVVGSDSVAAKNIEFSRKK